MEKTEVCRKVTGTNGGWRTLVYYLVDEGNDRGRYGVSVVHLETDEKSEARRLSNDRERIEKLIDLLATDCITPNSLEDVVYKFLAGL
ncbi:MAG: hypothetical protein E7456_05350 [Ruminococcaceae bacterium]|nr:hypothetical protein [Oscillospiraceae bacterium]